MNLKIALILLFSSVLEISCSNGMGGGGGSVSGNEGGSEPVNERDAYELQKSVNRCHRTGGTRVVKIKGEFKCY